MVKPPQISKLVIKIQIKFMLMMLFHLLNMPKFSLIHLLDQQLNVMTQRMTRTQSLVILTISLQITLVDFQRMNWASPQLSSSQVVQMLKDFFDRKWIQNI